MTGARGYPVAVELDWRQEGPQTWDITVETDGGRLELALGGAALRIDGARGDAARRSGSIPMIYRRFAELLRARARATSTRARSGSSPTPS